MCVDVCVEGNWGHCYSLFLLRTSRKKQRLQPRATWVDVLDGVCVSFLSTYSSNILGLHGEFQSPDEEGGAVAAELQSWSPIAVAGLRGAYCVCACLQALSVCVELGETETERAGNQSLLAG